MVDRHVEVEDATISSSPGGFHVSLSGGKYFCEVVEIIVVDSRHGAVNNKIRLQIDGHLVVGTTSLSEVVHPPSPCTVVDVWLDATRGSGPSHHQVALPRPQKRVRTSPGTPGGGAAVDPSVYSPMPGRVVKLLGVEGGVVRRGDPVVILEAMKMEHVVNSPTDGLISYRCGEGQAVADGDRLADITQPDAPPI